MFKLDDELLKELGLGSLPPAEKNKMLAHIYETLEMRVGMRLAQQMTDAQLDEFEAFIDRNDEAGALKWLESNFPDYKQVVADELEKLKSEIKAQAPMIVEATMANVAAGGAQPQAPADPAAYAQPAQPYYPPQPAQPAPQPQYQQPQPYQQPANDPYQQTQVQQPVPNPYQQPFTPPQAPADPAAYAQPAQPYYPPQPAQPAPQPQYQQPQPYQQPYQPAPTYQDPYQAPVSDPTAPTPQQDQQPNADQSPTQ